MGAIPLTVTEAAAGLRAGELSSVELTGAMLARADLLDRRLGSYLARFDEQALAAAAAADADLAAGVDRGPMQGIPVAVKDILAAAEGPTTAQSLILEAAWGDGRDAPIVSRLRAAGAVITGKVTTMEFACGMPDAAKPFPVPRNPWDLGTWPGGSSSGTGSGVAAGLFLAGIGTDTGGSIRCPAAFCGVSGLKATFGRVPKSGCVPLGYSLDHVGPLARSAADCAAMLSVLAGYDASDPDSADVPVPDYLGALEQSMAGVRVGVVREHHFPAALTDPAAPACFEAAVSALEGLGASVVEVSLPYFRELGAATMMTWEAEALAYHRGDLRTRWSDYFASTRVMVARGALVSGADYVQAQRVRRVAQRALRRLFEDVDVIVTPTNVRGAPRYDEHDRLLDIDHLVEGLFTPYWNSVGNPVLAVPMGFTGDGLPLSLQLAGRPFEEALVLRAADAYQRATDWHLRVPPLMMAAETAGTPA
jgi:aspartyl-tRNA(Asn)/glutamyl-tRNA(Gln) amidotransferase subunit A